MIGYVHLQNLRMLHFMRTMGFHLSDSSEEPFAEGRDSASRARPRSRCTSRRIDAAAH
jgi:hypothetical protein